jgi:hypothetical protein
MHRLIRVALCGACVLLQSCSRSNPEPPPDVLKVQREAMEKARSTGKMMQDAVQQRDAQMESQQK